MIAILWDGARQLKGNLEFKENSLSFKMYDFKDTDLNLVFLPGQIKELNYLKVFDVENVGLEIVTQQEKRCDLVV